MEPQADLAEQQIDYRHPLPVRVWHWANAAAIAVLLTTGLLIFDIHPHLYWGEDSGSGSIERERSLILAGLVLLRAIGGLAREHRPRWRQAGRCSRIHRTGHLGEARDR